MDYQVKPLSSFGVIQNNIALKRDDWTINRRMGFGVIQNNIALKQMRQ